MISCSLSRNELPFLSFFEEISAIPHGSGNSDGIADYLVNFAKARGLDFYRDKFNNVIIKKKATAGFESRPTLILQGHTDMVIATENGIDISAAPLSLYTDGDFLRAKGSTLGADDGIAVAYILAILDSKEIPHPAIEAVLTSDEEIGLIGAANLDTSVLSGKTMINIDSDEEGVFIAGCAGGLRLDAKLECTSSPVKEAYRIAVSGLIGGHSGNEIGKDRTNAIKLLFDLVDSESRIGEVKGGNADNAIPTYAECLIYPLGKTEENIKKAFASLKSKEDGLNIVCEAVDGGSLFTHEDSSRAIRLVREAPSGVINLNRDDPKLVETSLNLGLIGSSDAALNLGFSLRSSSDNEKRALADRLTDILRKYNAKTSESGSYPGWEYAKSSRLREIFTESYEALFTKKATTVTIHAGLECGIFAGKIAGLDCISLGPDNFDIHTTNERLSISSAKRVWELILDVLTKI